MFAVNIFSNVVRRTCHLNKLIINTPHNLGAILNFCTQVTDTRIEFRNISKDRTQEVPLETSLKYLKSNAYKITYGEEPVWVKYRRNHKGIFAPRKTRRTCIRKGVISTGNPCPICRDEYLILSEDNLDLIKQFISPYTGAVLSYSTTGLCQKKHQQLLVSVQRARDRGTLTFDVPFRKYKYSDYYQPSKN